MNWKKDIITTILVLVTVAIVTLVVFAMNGWLIGISSDQTKTWLALGLLVGGSVAFYLALILGSLFLLWLAVRIVRNAWRG